jgi:hypothetical protein
MKKKILFIISVIISIISPLVIIFITYSLLNFINYIYTNKAFNFINRNKYIIIGIILYIFIAIKLIKFNISQNYFNEYNYINLALIGQLMNCFILLIIIITTIFMPFLLIVFFHFVVSQLYLFVIFEDYPIIPIIINTLFNILITIIIFVISSLMPIIYANKAIIKLNINENNNIFDKINNINPIIILIKIIKIRNKIKNE